MPNHHPTSADFRTRAEAVVASQREARARHPKTGVCWSAMSPAYPVVERVEDVEAQLRETWAQHEAFRASPRGRFLGAVRELADDHGAEWHALMGYYDRSLADDRQPLNVEAVGRCLKILAAMEPVAAQDAELALSDLLIEAGSLALVAA